MSHTWIYIHRIKDFRRNSRRPARSPAGRFPFNNNGISIITTLLVMLMLSVLAGAAVSIFVIDTAITQDSYRSAQALFLAESGIQCALETQIDGDSDWSDAYTFTAAMGNGSFTVQFSNKMADSITITSTGSTGGISRAVSQSFTRIPGTPPDAFQYAMHSGNNTNMNSSSCTITGDISSGSGNINFGSGVTYTGTVYPCSGVNIPVVDFTGYYNDAPPAQRISGNYTFSAGTYSGIWYIDGDASIDDNVTVNGTIIATGSIDGSKADNVTIIGQNHYPAMLAGNQIKLNKFTNSYVEGLVYAGTDIANAIWNNMENVTFFGTIIAGNNLLDNSSNNITITYDESIMTSPPPHFVMTNASIAADSWKENY